MDFVSKVETLARRWRHPGDPEFPWWIPVLMVGSSFGGMFVAVGQRYGEHPLLPVLALGLLSHLPWLIESSGRRLPWPVFYGIAFAASSVLILRYPVAWDIAPGMWIILAGKLAAVERLRTALLGWGAILAYIATLGFTGLLDGALFWACAIVMGWDIGLILQFQQRRIMAHEREREQQAAQAVAAERQRIAREVHDVIAHSLSVTMLHLTAARRILEEDDDVPEAIEALRDAERQGREAMSDIRQTVGLLGSDRNQVAPMPDLTDLPTLVRGFQDAGLQVDLEVKGDLASVPATTGLGLYRVAQESLSNVAKHQPTAYTRVRVDVRNGQSLVVANELARPVRSPSEDGAGLRGMAERAELLGAHFAAGARGEHWVVELTVPGVRKHFGRVTCWLGLPPRRVERTAEPAFETRMGPA